jgi:hypothetical protein
MWWGLNWGKCLLLRFNAVYFLRLGLIFKERTRRSAKRSLRLSSARKREVCGSWTGPWRRQPENNRLPLKLPCREEQLYLMVVRGFGKEPMMLLINQPVKRSRESIWGIVESYLTRWRIEETLRFIKQIYNPEDIRLLT